MTRRCHVLHVLPDLQRGGGQIVALQLISHADTSRFVMHLASLRSPDELSSAFADAGAPPILLERGADGTLVAALELARHIRRRRIDLVHVHSDSDRKVGQLAALLTRRPVVGHLHSPWAHLLPMHSATASTPAKAWSRLKAYLRRTVERRVVRHYIAVADVVAAFHVGLVDAPIAIINNGIDLNRFSPATRDTRRRARTELGIDDIEPVLICVGRLTAGKGQDELIAMLQHVPGARLLLVGDGETRATLEQSAVSHGVADRVTFVGERDDVEALLPAADLFVLASVSEGLPLSVLEAMATRIPVVAYDLPGLRAVIDDGVEGRLVPLGDQRALAAAISMVLEDDHTYDAMALAARTTVTTRFDARQMTRAAEATYDVVLGEDPLDVRRCGVHRLVAR